MPATEAESLDELCEPHHCSRGAKSSRRIGAVAISYVAGATAQSKGIVAGPRWRRLSITFRGDTSSPLRNLGSAPSVADGFAREGELLQVTVEQGQEVLEVEGLGQVILGTGLVETFDLLLGRVG